MSRHTIEEIRAALDDVREVEQLPAGASSVLASAIAELEQRRSEDATFTALIKRLASEERNAGYLRRGLRVVADMRCCPLPSDHDAGEPDCPRVEAERALSAEKQRKARRRKAAPRA